MPDYQSCSSRTGAIDGRRRREQIAVSRSRLFLSRPQMPQDPISASGFPPPGHRCAAAHTALGFVLRDFAFVRRLVFRSRIPVWFLGTHVIAHRPAREAHL